MALKPPEHYSGKEQTYVKHFFLDRYLEALSYNVLSFLDGLIYVDGFSGPWRSSDEDYADTSFHIAIQALRRVRDGFYSRFNKRKNVRCIFVEKDPGAFAELEVFAQKIGDMPIKTIPGEFECAIPEIVREIDTRSFSLVFIDPTGWTGFGMLEIRPILQLRGEVLINFMFDDINRFLEESTRNKAYSYRALYGGPEWFDEFRELIREGWDREDAVLEVYRRRVKMFGNFSFATTTRIKKPQEDRSYYHLVYATRSWKGIHVFRDVEKKAAPVQENVRAVAKAKAKVVNERQDDLFSDLPIAPGPKPFEQERAVRLSRGKSNLLNLLKTKQRIRYKDLSAEVMQTPLVWDGDVKGWLSSLHDDGVVVYEGLPEGARTPRPDTVVLYEHV